MKVSVIVPVYNVEKYLDECLYSLVNQSLHDIEIIVVNDGSTDNSQLIINKYKKAYPDKIKAFIKSNGGLSDARNFGLEKASSEFIGFVDSDDYVDVNMFKILYELALSEEADIAECYYTNFYDDNEQKFVNSIYKTPNKYNGNAPIDDKSIIVEVTDMVWNRIYRSNLFSDNNIRFPNGLWHEDYAITPIILSKAGKYVSTEYIGYYYRQRENSISNSINIKCLEKIEDFKFTVKEMKRLETYNIFEDYLYIRYKRLAKEVMNKIIKLKKDSSFSVDLIQILKRMYGISILFENKYANESSIFIKEFNKAILNQQIFKFVIIIHLYVYLNEIKTKTIDKSKLK